MIKVDEDGIEMWERTYGGVLDESVSMVQQTKDGGYLLVGNCVDPQDFIADPGSAGYGGFEGRSNMYVVKTDGEGNELWSNTLEGEFNVLTVAGVESPQGGYYILGTKVYFPEKGDDLLLVMLDEEGQEVWTRTWEEDTIGGYAMIQDSEDNLIITGYIRPTDGNYTDNFLLKVDPLGIEIWQKRYGEEDFYEIGRDVIETKNGDYVILVDRLISFFASDDTSLLMGVNREGEVLWTSELENNFSLKGGRLIQNTDGDYILTGAKIDSKGWFSTVLIKIDKDGIVSK
jgi:hypothetical protein